MYANVCKSLKKISSGVFIPRKPATNKKNPFTYKKISPNYRDSGLKYCSWESPAGKEGKAFGREVTDHLIFQGIAIAIGGIKTWNPLQVEELFRKCDEGENPLGLLKNGHPNIFFIQYGEKLFALTVKYFITGSWIFDFHDFECNCCFYEGSRVFYLKPSAKKKNRV